MGLLCGVEEFINSLRQMVELLNNDYILKKGLNPTDIPKLNEFRNFINCIYEKLKNKEINSYEELIEKLNNFETINFKNCKIKASDVREIGNYIGLLLDAVQILKESADRHKKIKVMLEKSLERTGHTFILNEIENDKLNLILSEIRNTTALLIMLEILMRINNNKINPLANLRKSMGDRYPEEYFANLMAGWSAEIFFKENILGLPLQKTGADKGYNLFLGKPKDMGIADFSYKHKRIELQRVSIDKFKIGKNNDFYIIETPLKLHKIINSDIIVLWIGGINEIYDTIKCDKYGIFYVIRLNPLLKILTIKINKSILSIPKAKKNENPTYIYAIMQVESITNNLKRIRSILLPKLSGNPMWSFLNIMSFLKQIEKPELINKIEDYTQNIIDKIEFLKEKIKDATSTQEKRNFIIKNINIINELQEKTKFLFWVLEEFDNGVKSKKISIYENIIYVSKNGNEKIIIKTRKPEFYCSNIIKDKIFNLNFLKSL